MNKKKKTTRATYKDHVLILSSNHMEDDPDAAFEDYVSDALRGEYSQVSFAVDKGIQYAFIVYKQRVEGSSPAK